MSCPTTAAPHVHTQFVRAMHTASEFPKYTGATAYHGFALDDMQPLTHATIVHNAIRMAPPCCISIIVGMCVSRTHHCRYSAVSSPCTISALFSVFVVRHQQSMAHVQLHWQHAQSIGVMSSRIVANITRACSMYRACCGL